MLLGALALSLTAIVAAPAAPALAMNRVACNEGGYLRIWFWSWTSDGFEYEDSICFANKGFDDEIYIRRATRLWSGENAGMIDIVDKGRVEFARKKDVTLGGDVEYLEIL